ncbi:3-hydroxybutyrate dehydrogenase [Noviherbaspirillum sp. UKPF54]|uniref:3-hydroxybutyrate dehydrogenase n=1 Tax=Noviherbaspirillum sp. UKPF54 TaxID=2601898 RepID=UPI0011B19F10|nr:3-hydroxybutyrate dehydrogenase [Noviherbaspirillum sp. UKPF54]QDZ29695.1 3-hydroxybutyrate dehydrogenase [Noviherbaspirillum sp. UKPF54]
MLKGRLAVVTGSTSGIGLGIARGLARQGADILLNGFGDAELTRSLCTQISEEFHVRVLHHGADMSSAEQIRNMITYAVNEFGRLDILVNNAGIQHTATVDQFPEERWDAVIAVNLSSNFHTIKAALPHMKARSWGRIINVASVHGLVGSMNKSAYVAAKHGVVGLTKVVALETAQTGISCNAICPGWVLTPLVQRQIDDLAARENITNEQAQARLLGEKQPSGDFATPEQIAELAVFLCSDSAAQIRGAAFAIDGGWTAQ